MNNVKMIIGNDCVLDNINEFQIGEKALIVTGKSSAKLSGAFDDVSFALTMQNIGYEVYDKINQNPTVESCIDAAKFGHENECDFVIGIGGGSVLDATKAIAVLLHNSDLTEPELYEKKWDIVAPFILVGTTAGTGSELTQASVLTDSNKRKHSIHDEDMYALVSFGNPRYTYSLNKDFTISTAIDALCHCVESYFSNKANDETRKYAVEGIKILYPELLNLLRNDSIENSSRDNLYLGSIKAGYAIDVTGTTFAHNVGYYLTENFKVPHGVACGCFLEDVIEFQKENNNSYYQSFLTDIDMTIDDFAKVYELIPKLDIKLSMDIIEEILPRWNDNNSVKNTYGKMTVNDIKKILVKHFA